MARREDRLIVSPGALLSPSEAAALLPGDDAGNLAELYRLDLVRVWRGRPTVRWADVLAVLGPATSATRDEEAGFAWNP